MNFDAVFTAKKETSKEDFLRGVLIELASSSKTPADVVDAKFGEIEESVREAIVCTAHIEMDYSASIGYDRQETYWTTEKKYNSSTKRYYDVNVQKTRTVTDWRPYSGHISGVKTAAAFNESHSGLHHNDTIVDVIKSAADGSIVPKGEATVNYAGLEAAKSNCAFFLELDIKLPGDRRKDKSTNSDITVQSISCYKLPCYTVEFTYNGKKYSASGFACGRPNITAVMPENDVNIEEEVNKKTDKLKKATKALWFGFLGSFILTSGMLGLEMPWFGLLTVAALIAAIGTHKAYNNKYNQSLSDLTTNLKIAKETALEDALKKYSFEKLSEKERSDFNEKTNSANIAYQSSRKKSGGKKRTIFGIIATVILSIACISTGISQAKERLHSPTHLDMEIVAKSEEYKSNVSPYTNGCYFIHFDYKITSNKLAVRSMSIITYVYDKSTGEELGYITTSFSDMNLDEGGTKTFSTEWKENQPEKNNFFSTLYEMELEDLEFKYEYDYIHFDDGEYYHGDLD